MIYIRDNVALQPCMQGKVSHKDQARSEENKMPFTLCITSLSTSSSATPTFPSSMTTKRWFMRLKP